MKKATLFVGLMLIVLAVMVTGCATPKATINEFDQSGKLVKQTITEDVDAIQKITEATKNKTIIAWSDGWAAYISASTATKEDPTPTGKIFAGKVAKGYISLLKNQKGLEHIAEIIYATKSDLKVTTSGVSNTSSTAPNKAEKEAVPETGDSTDSEGDKSTASNNVNKTTESDLK